VENQHLSVTRFFPRTARAPGFSALIRVVSRRTRLTASIHALRSDGLRLGAGISLLRSRSRRVISEILDNQAVPHCGAGIVCGRLLAYRRRWRELGCFAVIAIGGALLSEWLKEFVSRPRPSALSFIDYGNSFPSGHLTSAATIFGAAYYFLGEPCGGQWWRRYLATVGVVGLVLVIAFQRVYFTHHLAFRCRRLRLGRAPQTIWHFFKPTTTVDLPLARSGEYYLMFAAPPRVALESAGCRKIDLVLNDRPIKTLVLHNG